MIQTLIEEGRVGIYQWRYVKLQHDASFCSDWKSFRLKVSAEDQFLWEHEIDER